MAGMKGAAALENYLFHQDTQAQQQPITSPLNRFFTFRAASSLLASSNFASHSPSVPPAFVSSSL
jgi:hypothetical protein